MYRQMVLVLGAVLLLPACVSTKATMLDPMAPKYTAVPPHAVVIYTSESELAELEYVRLAIIEASGSGEWTSQSGMLEAIRKKAGGLGANGVLLPSIDEPGAGAKVAGAVFDTGTKRTGNAIAIRVLGAKPPSE